MKKFAFLLLVTLSILLTTVAVPVNAEVPTLRVYNWDEYIDEGKDEEGNQVGTSIVDDFEAYYQETYGVEINVEYSTYPTNEELYNTLRSGDKYDLVCPSDYMIQRMIRQDMLEQFDMDENGYTKMPNYQENVSPYLLDKFHEKGWDQYAVGYMWGTMGYIYDPEKVSEDLVKSWDLLWNSDFQNRVTVKDSVRDTYLIGVAHVYKNELLDAAADYEDGTITRVEYQELVSTILNRTDDETISKVETALNELKKNVYSFEVDSGKNDIVSGKIDANLAWSGDAVYAIFLALDEDNKVLNYAVPEEGGNLWFDGWVMPKGANKDLAQAFLDYLSMPEVAVKNMSYIGYTSAIAGQDLLDLANEWYSDEEGTITVDLSYFFEGTVDPGTDMTVTTTEDYYGQLIAQYPDEDTIARCAIMEDFGDQEEAVIEMWQRVKSNAVSPWIYVTVIAVVLAIGGGYFYLQQTKKMRVDRLKAKSSTKNK